MTDLQEDWIQAAIETEEAQEVRIFSGLYEHLSNEDYHRSTPIGSTGLKRILQSPAHFRYPKKFDSTRAKETGTAIHCAIWEPERFLTDYRIVECDARTSALYKAACKDMPKDRVFTSAEFENIKGMQAGAMRNTKTRQLIEMPGRCELSLFTVHPGTGVAVKCRYDKLSDSGMPIDLKKTQVSSRDAFSRSVHAYGYHISAAFYMDCWEWQYGEKLDVMRWLAVEEQSPHVAMRYRPDPDALMIGRAMYTEALEIYAKCLDRDEWPGYDDEEELPLPSWAVGQFEEGLEVNIDD